MGEAARKRITIDEFLAFEGEGDTRYELVAGEIVAMAPPSVFHGAIAVKLASALDRALKPPCRAISEAGVRLSWRNDAFYQADLAVTCAPLRQGVWAIPDPVAIFEVLSPSTEARDLSVKLRDYRLIASVQEIVVIATDRPRVEHWLRRGLYSWSVDELRPGDRLRLESIGFDIPVDALYDGLDLSADADAEG